MHIKYHAKEMATTANSHTINCLNPARGFILRSSTFETYNTGKPNITTGASITTMGFMYMMLL